MNKGVKMAHGSFLNIVMAGDWLEKMHWNRLRFSSGYWAVTGDSIYERGEQCRCWLTVKQKTRILVSHLRAWEVLFSRPLNY